MLRQPVRHPSMPVALPGVTSSSIATPRSKGQAEAAPVLRDPIKARSIRAPARGEDPCSLRQALFAGLRGRRSKACSRRPRRTHTTIGSSHRHKAAQHRRDDVTETIGGDGSSVLWFKGQVGQPLGVILRLDSAPRSATYERHRTAEGIGDVDWFLSLLRN
jgi:hypothetical protein